MNFKNVLLASDFDGTLKNDDGIITDDVKSAISRFMSNGGYFTVCTGRILQGFHLYSKDYINAPVLLGNGAMAYDYEKKSVIFNDAIGEEGLASVKDILNIFPDIPIEFYNIDCVCAINLNKHSEQHFTSQGIDFKIIQRPEDAPLPWTKVMIAAHGCSRQVQEILDKHPEINYLRTTGDYVEILKKGVDKGTGLLKLAKHLKCEQCDIYAAGDGYNDVEMLVAAAGGFVPENGSPEALAVGKYITRSNNKGCIAHAIEILQEKYE
ncbi:MAG: Cof-type HAD-IIB family hydrolase [Clostridia bacterium]|nr:Cof-type HAD-IIB family hydrolase [Clostridia bacterium]